jgi:hypothetical protein
MKELVGVDEDPPGTAVAAPKKVLERLALALVGALVVVGDRFAAALVDSLRPVREEGQCEAVERDVVVAALRDPPGPAAFAMLSSQVATSTSSHSATTTPAAQLSFARRRSLS